MDHKHIIRTFPKGGYPCKQPVPVRVSADSFNILNVGPYINLLPKNLNGLCTVLEQAPQGSLCLVSCKDNGTFRPPEIMLQMMPDSARITHACCGYDYLGRHIKVDVF